MNPFMALIAHLQNALQNQVPGLGLGLNPQQTGFPGLGQVAPGPVRGFDTSVSPKLPVAAPITPPAQSPSRPSNPFAGLGGGTGAGGCVC